MKMKLHPLSLRLAHPFTISRGSISTQDSLVVELRSGTDVGWGEVTSNSYYGHTTESLAAALDLLRPHLADYADQRPEDVWDTARQVLNDNHFALSAFDIALHDLHARCQRQPLYRSWGLDWNAVPPSSYTIGIDSIDRMVNKLAEQPGWPVYKIKLGTSEDLTIVQELRRHTDARFRVDANGGWQVDEAIANSAVLAGLGVELIEQPLPASAGRAEQHAVFATSKLPIIADESCQTEADVEACQGCFHGINVKLCKCGGLTPALRMLRAAKRLGLKTMVGCMIESSIGISAAAQLLPLLDFADLDGAALLAKDPATGVKLVRGHLTRPDVAGTGASL